MIFHFNFSIGYSIYGTAILFFLYWQIRCILKREPLNSFARLFGRMAIFAAIAMAIYSLFYIFFGNNSFYLWLANTIGQPFLIISFVYALSVFFLIIKPNIPFSKIVIPLSIIGVFLSLFFHFKYPFLPTFDKHGFMYWNASFLVSLNYSIFYIIGFLPLSIALLINGIKDKEVRGRSLFLAFALILVLGDTFSTAGSKTLYIFGNLCVSLGFTLLLFAYLWRGKREIIS